MEVIADLHIHSRFAMACSQNITVESLDLTAKEKGIKIVGTGDFTHPLWIDELQLKLEEAEPGLYKAKGSKTGTRFVLSAEVSNIFDSGGRNRKVHNCMLVPSLDDAKAINDAIKKKGALESDGRPALNLSCSALVEKAYSVTKDAIVFPAHCLLPNEMILANPTIKAIKDIKEGDKVFTHRGRVQTVKKMLKRVYSGKVIKVTPWYFGTGVKTTPEHPYLGIKTVKNCSWSSGSCRPTKAHIRNCVRQHYKNYKPSWILANNLEIGDVLLYPRFTNNIDIKRIKTGERARGEIRLPKEVKIDGNFCKIAGYYLAEGYTNGRDAIGFSFNKEKELGYVNEVKLLVSNLFGIQGKQGKTAGDVMFYSKALVRLFENLFYEGRVKKAESKAVPQWMLFIPKRKQAMLFKAWWVGDRGYTVSRLLHNQMKIICLRLGIVPSTRIDHISDYERRGKHFIGTRRVKANHDLYIFDHLAVLEDKYGILNDDQFRMFIRKTDKRHGWMDKDFAYLPIRRIDRHKYKGQVFNLEVETDNSYLTESASVHNCWTPWFGVLGSSSGFDSFEQAYEDQVKHVYALEMGLSSDASMNWRLSQLDKYTLLSNSDAHSLPKMGREANVFEIGEKDLSYKALFDAIKGKRLKMNVGFYPEEGKYHYDGHRNCNVSLSPSEAKKYNGRCPVCGKPLTIGVMNRVNQLADREEGYVPKDAVPYVHAVPLLEILAHIMKKTTTSPVVKRMYDELVAAFGTEFNLLLKADPAQIRKMNPELAVAIENVRAERVSLIPGYDGVFGIVDIMNTSIPEKGKGKQASMSDFTEPG